jgi:heat shock protein HslJ
MNFKRISSCVVGMVFLMVSGQAQSNNRLVWTEWNQITPSTIKPTLAFTDSSMSAFAGCNRIFGSYKLTGSKLSFSNLGSTKMACEASKMKLEQTFVDALAKIQSFKLSKDGKTLNLTGKNTRLNFGFARATPNAFVESSRKILNVSPEKTPCFDDAQKQCLLLEDLSDGTGWGKFTESQIEGLNFEAGYSYQIQVAVETNPRNQQRRLRLLELVMQHWTKAVTPNVNQRILEVAPNLADCVGVVKTQCLQVREVGSNWQNFFGTIEGFSYKPDYSYKLLVNVTKLENPPADGSSLIKYSLVRLLDLDPVRR